MLINWLHEIPWLAVAGLIIVGYLIGIWGTHRAIRDGRMTIFNRAIEEWDFDPQTGRFIPPKG